MSSQATLLSCSSSGEQAANLRPSRNLDDHVEDVFLGVCEVRNVMPWRDGHVRIGIGFRTKEGAGLERELEPETE